MPNCKECGQPIKWIKGRGGWRPFNVCDGKLHFDTCVPNPEYEAKLIEEKELEDELNRG
jgi:hypothetical protein